MNVDIGERGRTVSFLGIHKWDLLCSVVDIVGGWFKLRDGNRESLQCWVLMSYSVDIQYRFN
jgi:hypothetical protein